MSRWGYIQRGLCLEGVCPRGLCPKGLCPVTHVNLHKITEKL